jgi:hypothetical protein
VVRANSVPMRSGWAYGRSLSRSALTIEKMAVLAPMERASVTVTVQVKAGLRLSWRTANLKNCIIVPDTNTGMTRRSYDDPEN